jgi:hypothetical protein
MARIWHMHFNNVAPVQPSPVPAEGEYGNYNPGEIEIKGVGSTGEPVPPSEGLTPTQLAVGGGALAVGGAIAAGGGGGAPGGHLAQGGQDKAGWGGEGVAMLEAIAGGRSI